MVVLLVEEFAKEKPGVEKKIEAVRIIKGELDKNIYNVLMASIFLEEAIIGFGNRLYCEGLNASGIFSKRRVRICRKLILK